jgi:N-acyl homoserine lactone hydrolase
VGRLRGYLPNRWPSWFDPVPLGLAAETFGPFGASRRLTRAGDVVAVATPGHTADHVSVLVQEEDAALFLAGDTSYNENLMLSGKASPGPARRFICRRTIRNPVPALQRVAWLGTLERAASLTAPGLAAWRNHREFLA